MKTTTCFYRAFLLAALIVVPSHLDATPIMLISSPKHIFIGTNQKDSGGKPSCKLISNSAVAVLKAQDNSKIEDLARQTMLFDSNWLLWNAIKGDPNITATKARIVSSLEAAARQFVRAHDEGGLGKGQSHKFFLASLRANVVLATVNHGKRNLDLFTVTFSGWPIPSAHTSSYKVPEPSVNFGIVWYGDEPPTIKVFATNTDDSTAPQAILAELANMAKDTKSAINSEAFQPPFEVFSVDGSSVKRIVGDPKTCIENKTLASKNAASFR